MKKLYLLALALTTQVVVTTAAHAEAYCREYTQVRKIGNAQQKGYGTACMQADGSWQIMTPPQPVPANNFVQPVVQAPVQTTTYIMEDAPVVYYRRPAPVPVIDVVLGGYHGGHHRSCSYRHHGWHGGW